MAEAKQLDLSIFNKIGRKCNKLNKGQNQDINIVAGCQYLQRLISALKYYAVLNPSKNKLSRDIFYAFCVDVYKTNLLDDYTHLLSVHSNHLQDIKQSMIKDHGFANCDVSNCSFSHRHYNERTSSSSETNDAELETSDHNNVDENDTFGDYLFYSETFDSLHFYINHLYQVGLRCNINMDRIKQNKNEDEDYECMDHAFAQITETITAQREKYQTMFARFKSDNNKYNIYVDNDNNDDVQETKETWTYLLFQNMKKNGIKTYVIAHVHSIFSDDEYDSDAIIQDVDDSGSNILNQIENSTCSIIRHYVDYTKASTASFNTGLIFWYWPYYDPKQIEQRKEQQMQMQRTTVNYNNINDFGGYDICDLYIKNPKYQSLKEEIINSDHCTMKLYQKHIILKCDKYINTQTVKKIRCTRKNDDLHYGIKKGTPLSQLPQLIHAIFLYCDFSDLCTAFSSTFRPSYFGEALESIKKRNQDYFFFSKALRELVEYFGKRGKCKDNEVGPFYCGMSCVLAIPSFNMRICSPTSTSKQIQVATNFAKQDGIIIQLNNTGGRYSIEHLRVFDCSVLGRYKEEDERLFVGGEYRIRIESIRIIETKQNFEPFFHCLFYFDCMISGTELDQNRAKNINNKDCLIANELIKYQLGLNEEKRFDDYIYMAFHLFCHEKNVIVLNLRYLYLWFRKISHLIMYDVGEHGRNLFRELLFELFPNITRIIMYTTSPNGMYRYTFGVYQFISLYSQIDSFKSRIEIEIKASPSHRSGTLFTMRRNKEVMLDPHWKSHLEKANFKAKLVITKNLYRDSKKNVEHCLIIQKD